MLEYIRRLYGRPTPANPYYWHEWHTFLPARLNDGSWTFDPVWRRKTASGWEYSSREEREEDFWHRQW